MKAKLNVFHIDKTENFDELVLQKREGRNRTSFVPFCDIEQVYKNFKANVNPCKGKVYQFPHVLKEDGVNIFPWSNVIEIEQFIIDTRNAYEKEQLNLNMHTQTLKESCDVWNERP